MTVSERLAEAQTLLAELWQTLLRFPWRNTALTLREPHGVVAGIHNGTPEAANARTAKGFRFTTVSSDARLMAAGAQQLLAQMRRS